MQRIIYPSVTLTRLWVYSAFSISPLTKCSANVSLSEALKKMKEGRKEDKVECVCVWWGEELIDL